MLRAFALTRARVRVALKKKRKKKKRFVFHAAGYRVGKSRFCLVRIPISSLFAPPSYFSADRFSPGRQLARDRLSVVGTRSNCDAATGFNLQVGLFHASQTWPGPIPEYAARPPASRRQFAISCQFCYLVLRLSAQLGMR